MYLPVTSVSSSPTSSSATVWGCYSPWEHQRRSLNSCIRLESQPFKMRVRTFDTTQYLQMRACVGVLALKPGCGKTLIVSALIRSLSKADASPEDTARLDPYRLTTIGGNVASVPTVKVLDTTLIVVGSILCGQWRDTLLKAGIPESKVHVCTGRVLNRKRVNMEAIEQGRYEVVVVSNYLYSKIFNELSHVAFWRVVIDEADSLAIPNFEVVPSRFMWLVTGTPAGLGNQKHLKKIVKQIDVHRDHMYVTGTASNPLPPVEYTQIMPMYKSISELDSLNVINMNALKDFQKRDFAMTPPPKLLRMGAHTETVMHDRCCLTLRRMEEFSDIVSMHCCPGIVSGKYLSRHIERQKSRNLVPKCVMCNSMIGPAIMAELPEPVDLDVYNDMFESLHPIGATHKVVQNLLNDDIAAMGGSSGAQKGGQRIIIFKESTLIESQMTSLLDLARQHEYKVIAIDRYTQLDKRLDVFARGRAILLLNTDHAQGINIPTGDVIILTHTVTKQVFQQLVCRARRHPRTELVKVFHMQME